MFEELPFWLRMLADGRLLIGVTLLIWALFYVLFVYVVPLDKVGWKRVDYAWLAVAALGFFGLAAQNRELMASLLLQSADTRSASALKWLHQYTGAGSRAWLLTPTTQTAMSPPNYDGIVAQRAAAAAWLEQLERSLPAEGARTFAPLPADVRTIPSSITERPIRESLENVKTAADGYTRLVTAAESLQKVKPRTENEQGWSMLSPILLCLAIGLRLAKVGGEIRLERAKAVAPATATATATATPPREASGPPLESRESVGTK